MKYEEGVALARQLGCRYYETSAYLRNCIDEVFHGIVREIRDKEKEKFDLETNPRKKAGKVKKFFTSLKPTVLFKKEHSSKHSSKK